MLSFSYKWLGERKVHSVALPDFPRYASDPHDDEDLVGEFAKILAQADIVVWHNGSRFDHTTTNTRLVFHGHDPLPKLNSVDTLTEARRVFKFPSNRLDDLGEYLQVGRKVQHSGKHLWLSCMNGDAASWKLMRRYNNGDVLLLEKVYLKLRPFIRHHNVNIATGKMGACPKCSSTSLQSRGFGRTKTGEFQRFQCQSCGSWSSGKSEPVAKKITIV